ncbi:MAG: hypothetical protein A3A10_01245 [Candidatus Tagabacteria bacterium RIFCSPLOWO2_01_FULL_42_9]|uniref:Uncharacterized protein n=1 Tax=Candidatus Tagabacteria bacterium RIFCSPLOWO2_01_FULL_42_9 TaxID=1802296 RepID=A0A1G2LWJ4_9BACT|nr:MAG: hypothetical protein A3A10_01245 [Candidatus Tagabacteria bacterium RIFCSPLOWO2_01_FULL_42_9]
MSSPNVATWTIWTYLVVLNVSSYYIMTGDLVKSFVGIISAIAVLLTFLISLVFGKFSRPKNIQLLMLAIGLVAGLVWWICRSATYANLIMQGCLVISFIPMFIELWGNPNKETPLSWFLWAAAYGMAVAAVLLRWNGNVVDIIFPLRSAVFHAAVGFLAMRKPRPIISQTI